MKPSAQQLDEIAARRRTPSATYRLQFNRDFTFAQAQKYAGYLRDLGVTDLYASPVFQVGPESTHGYDICSFEQLNPRLGPREDFDALTARLHELGLGLLLDMVPNHMGNDLSNCWWTDLLAHGPSSPFATYFDINWQPVQPDLHNRVLLPALEDHYGRVLEAGKLRLVLDEGAFSIAYYERRFPVAGCCYPDLLEEIAAEMQSQSPDQAMIEMVREYVEGLRQRKAAADLLPADTPGIREQIRGWNRTSPGFHDAVERVFRAFNGVSGKPGSFDKLHDLLARQHYRLAFWRAGPEEINYRRFFDVTDLVSVRMELDIVFRACHPLVFELLHRGQVSGLRIDHPDGLWDPQDYFRRLQAGYLLTSIGEPLGFPVQAAELAVSTWLTERLAPLERLELHRHLPARAPHTLEAPRNDPLAGKESHPQWPVYVVAEKILSGSEPLRQDWPVEGTTGYDFLNKVNGLFVDGANREAFDRCYREFTGNHSTARDIVYQAKKSILETSLVSELTAVTHRLKQLAQRTRHGQDFTLRQLRRALAEIIAAFPVYRTYITEGTVQVAALERFHIEQAVAEAKARNPHLEIVLLDFIQDLLLLRLPADFDEETGPLHRKFIARFQQLTGPVTAKGLEDTAFYRYNRLVSINEVGSDPDCFGVSLDEFHEHNGLKAEQWPHALLATSTHDTKRGEDVRARINVLSELPAEWEAAVQRWARLNAGRKSIVNGSPAPSTNDEWLIYQTLAGAWPFSAGKSGRAFDLPVLRGRIAAFMQKAAKEAKLHTSWTDPNTAYEQAMHRFIHGILDPGPSAGFLSDFAGFQARIAFFGQFNSLAQLLLKITSPGVPDFYQGTELWDLNLVDPDNRQPVDYDLRQRMLSELQRRSKGAAGLSELARELLERGHTGEVKLYVTFRALAFRRQFKELFRDGNYLPLVARGPRSDHVCAYARRLGDKSVITVVPRLVVRLAEGKQQAPMGTGVWLDTRLDLSVPGLPGRFRDVLTGRELDDFSSADGQGLRLSEVLSIFPVALLERI